MMKLFIFCLLLLLSVKAFSFTAVDTGTYNSADFKAIQLQECLDELDYQYTGLDGKIDYSDDLTVNEMIEMETECRKETK